MRCFYCNDPNCIVLSVDANCEAEDEYGIFLTMQCTNRPCQRRQHIYARFFADENDYELMDDEPDWRWE